MTLVNDLCFWLSGSEPQALDAFLSLFGVDLTCLVGPAARQPAVMQLAGGKYTVVVEDVEVGEADTLSEAVLFWCAIFSVFAQPCPRDVRKPVLVFMQTFVFGIQEGVVPSLCWRVGKTLGLPAPM